MLEGKTQFELVNSKQTILIVCNWGSLGLSMTGQGQIHTYKKGYLYILRVLPSESMY